MQQVTLPKSELQDLLMQAAKMGAQQGIEAAMQNSQTQPDHIKLPQVIELVGFSETEIWRRLKADHKRYDPTFPKPFKKGNGRQNYWLRTEVQAWNNQQEQARQA